MLLFFIFRYYWTKFEIVTILIQKSLIQKSLIHGGMKMKIQSSSIDLYGDSKLEQKNTVNEKMRYWVDGQSMEAATSLESPKDSLVLSNEVLARLQQMADSPSEVSKSDDPAYELSPKDRELIALLERFLSELTGKKVKIIIPEIVLSRDQKNISLQLPNSQRVELNNQSGEVTNQRQGWGLDYHYDETVSEKESMLFLAQGKIKTEDGREIDFKLQMNMSREFTSSQSLDIKAGDALIDPLIINFDGGSPELTETKIQFDLDSDGVKEDISFLGEGSGFLALDKNGDGQINNGKELFGTLSGNGFSELAQYDSDKNGWIDENDPIFDRLSIWTKDSSGNDQLTAIGMKGIGAIYMGNITTAFSLKDSENNLEGQIRESGVFVKENGQVGTIQHLDLVV